MKTAHIFQKGIENKDVVARYDSWSENYDEVILTQSSSYVSFILSLSVCVLSLVSLSLSLSLSLSHIISLSLIQIIREDMYNAPNIILKEILKRVPLAQRRSCRVLDVAAGTGKVGKDLQKEGFT